MLQLFRSEVAQSQIKRLQGEVLLGVRRPWLLLGYVAAGVIIAAFVFACFGTYTRRASVTGRIMPVDGIIRLAARSGGVVDKIYVHEGDDVKPGQPLAGLRLSLDTDTGDSGPILMESVRGEIEAGQANTSARIDQLSANRSRLATQEGILTRQREDAVRLMGFLEEKQAIAERNYQRVQTLTSQGFLSRQALDTARTSKLEADQNVVTQNNAILQIDQSLNEVRHGIAETPILANQLRSQGKSSYAQSIQKLEQIKIGAAYTINSPSAGRVLAIPGLAGQAVSPGDAVVVMSPLGSALEVELFIPSRAAGFIRIGQDVSIQYDAYSYKTFGSGHGRILALSPTMLTPAEVARLGFTVSEPVFRARASLDRDYVNAYGEKVPLQPGMMLAAEVAVDRRSLVEWLLDPLYAVGKRR